jgi:nitric-oxide synthase
MTTTTGQPYGATVPIRACPRHVGAADSRPSRSIETHDVLADASKFMELFRSETRPDERLWCERRNEIADEIAQTGTYTHTRPELQFGAQIAWRNHTRCVGKFYWRTLLVRDCRTSSTATAIANELVEHLRIAYNGGRIKPVLSVFAADSPLRAGPRILNDQLVRYAGYRQPDGSVIGDPANTDLTDRLRNFGWSGGSGGRFDVLPVGFEVPDTGMHLLELPPDAAVEVPISHPCLPWFDSLGLRWYAFPTIANMRLDIGGVSYAAAPFSGWYVGTEIGARNFGDESRYDLLPVVAQHMGLDTRSNRTLWKDRALVELNDAVLWSFTRAGVRLADHHTIAEQFHRYTEVEKRAGRVVHAEWAWMVPAMSPTTSPVYHTAYDAKILRPNFFRVGQDDAM